MPRRRLEPSSTEQARVAMAEEIADLAERTTNPSFARVCLSFLGSIQEGDVIEEFCSAKDDWQQGVGEAGFRLIRNGTKVTWLRTKLS